MLACRFLGDIIRPIADEMPKVKGVEPVRLGTRNFFLFVSDTVISTLRKQMLAIPFLYKNVITWSSDRVNGKTSYRSGWAWPLQPSRLDAKSRPRTPASIPPCRTFSHCQ